MKSGLERSNDKRRNPDMAWECAACLISARVTESELLPTAVVYGGFLKRARHDEALSALRYLLSLGGRTATASEETLWEAVSKADYEARENDPVAWGAARALVGTDCITANVVTKDAETDGDGKHVHLVRVLLAEANDEPDATDFLATITGNLSVGGGGSRAFVRLLDDKSPRIAFPAAQLLIRFKDTEHFSLPFALVRGGFSDHSKAAETSHVLADLSKSTTLTQAVRAALLWAIMQDKREIAWHAAAYMMDHNYSVNVPMVRALTPGEWLFEGSRRETEQRLAKLLRDPASRPSTVDALLVEMIEDKTPEQFHIATLLVQAGVPLYDRLLASLGRMFEWESRIAPLALLALAGRVDEARTTARRGGLTQWTRLLGDEPFPG
jgi:hypothetical protein